MSATPRKQLRTWEEAVAILRADPQHRQLIFDAYLTADLSDNCRRFRTSTEFDEALALLRKWAPGAQSLLDMPGGNGIATCAFAGVGYDVTAVEPDPSESVGRGAVVRALAQARLTARVVDGVGEHLPFESGTFDVAYVRQGLHHAKDLPRMVEELGRVLRPNGILLACREHVVDNYGASLQAFLASQVDHQLYGGEHAFTLADYRKAFSNAALEPILELGPYDSAINTHPNDPASLRMKILESGPGRILGMLLPDDTVASLGVSYLKARRAPGRLYSFLLRRPA
ncbi:MAG: class I SAM-dependent methyltransferase [Steroidobacteraceae bacterium]